MFKLPYILRAFRENTDKVMALCSSAHFDLVSKMSQSTQARVLQYYMLIGDDVEITWFVFLGNFMKNWRSYGPL